LDTVVKDLENRGDGRLHALHKIPKHPRIFPWTLSKSRHDHFILFSTNLSSIPPVNSNGGVHMTVLVASSGGASVPNGGPEREGEGAEVIGHAQ